MIVAKTVREVRDARRAEWSSSWGLVPTMGYLHEGHLSLVRRAGEENERVGASIFVNPTQFGPNEDLATYPRDLERDLGLLEKAGADLVFAPDPEEMYPQGFQTYVVVEDVTKRLEGARRPGHFRGVTTVVAKLFDIFQPTRAYFGQKDAQQAVVIGRMARDLDMPLEVVVCPTVREPDGLAMSSRNTYLDAPQRKAATVLYRALCAAEKLWRGGGRNADALRRAMLDVLEAEPLARVDYVSAAHPETLEECGVIEDGGGVLLSLAVFIGKTRLIDNFRLES